MTALPVSEPTAQLLEEIVPESEPSPLTSIIIPAYNESRTLLELVERVEAQPIPKEIVVVDDGSSNDSEALFEEIEARGHRVIRHPVNRGKGAAVRTGLQAATGEIVIVQDADLELDPGDYAALLAPIHAGEAEVVYGSRFLSGRTDLDGLSTVRANRLLTLAVNAAFGSSLTDVMTCYKVMRRSTFTSLDLASSGFEMETEITAKLLRRGIHIREVPVSYRPRTVADGKKIRWRHSARIVGKVLLVRFLG